MKCGSSFLFLKKKVLGNFVYCFVPALCKSWSCLSCRRKKAHIVKCFIERSFSGRPIWLLSVTFFHSGDPLDVWKSIGEKCNRLLVYARKYSGTFDYVRVIEPHSDGLWPHVHILCTKPIASARFVQLLTDWGFGWNFHSVPKDAYQCASYVSKYLSKEWPSGSADLLRQISKTRLVSSSRSLGAIFTSDAGWICVDHDLPDSHGTFLCNLVIKELKDRGALHVLSTSLSPGFMVESDIDLPLSFINDFLDPYIWRVCEGCEYTYFPHGLQQVMSL